MLRSRGFQTWLILFLLVAAFAPRGLRAEHLDFVIDLDDVMWTAVRNGQGWFPGQSTPPEKIIRWNDIEFRMADGAGEFLLSLSQIPGARISFFSSNSYPDRNSELLKQIKLPDGRSAHDLAEGRVFSGDRLKREKIDCLLCTYKDLTIVAPDVDLDRAVLIDDQENYAKPSQKRNLLHAWGMMETVPEEVLDSLRGGSHRKDELRTDYLVRNKLARMRGIIDASLELSRNEGIPFVDALSRLQWQDEEMDRLRKEYFGIEYARRGIKLLREVNPQFHGTPLLTKRNCWEELRELNRHIAKAKRE